MRIRTALVTCVLVAAGILTTAGAANAEQPDPSAGLGPLVSAVPGAALLKGLPLLGGLLPKS